MPDSAENPDPGPAAEDLEAYFGAAPSAPIKEEDEPLPMSDKPLPDLEYAEKRIPAKTKALMQELFRAKLDKVQRIDPRKVK